jgi:hypothetical protein
MKTNGHVLNIRKLRLIYPDRKLSILGKTFKKIKPSIKRGKSLRKNQFSTYNYKRITFKYFQGNANKTDHLFIDDWNNEQK